MDAAGLNARLGCYAINILRLFRFLCVQRFDVAGVGSLGQSRKVRVRADSMGSLYAWSTISIAFVMCKKVISRVIWYAF